jgi:hypothetical protein
VRRGLLWLMGEIGEVAEIRRLTVGENKCEDSLK